MLTLLIALAAAGAASSNPNLDYHQCVQDHAKRWSQTGEAATVIVNTSLASCKEQKAAVKAWAKAQPNSTGLAVENWVKIAENAAREDAYKTVLDAKVAD